MLALLGLGEEAHWKRNLLCCNGLYLRAENENDEAFLVIQQNAKPLPFLAAVALHHDRVKASLSIPSSFTRDIEIPRCLCIPI